MESDEIPALPIEATFTLDETTISSASMAAKNVLFPRWLQIAFPIVVIANPLFNVVRQAGKGGVMGTVAVLVAGAAIYGLMNWLAVKSKRVNRARLEDTQVTGKFWNDHLDLIVGQRVSSISYSRVTRVGRDTDGLILVFGKRGSQWFPSAAFRSLQHRDAAFNALAAALRVK